MSQKGCLLVVVALAFPAGAIAAREPTQAERVAITRALPANVRAIPAGCVYLKERVSRDPKYARVDPINLLLQPYRASDPCIRYAGDGFFLLTRTGGRWRVVYQGSDPPPCSRHFPRDLTTCLP